MKNIWKTIDKILCSIIGTAMFALAIVSMVYTIRHPSAETVSGLFGMWMLLGLLADALFDDSPRENHIRGDHDE